LNVLLHKTGIVECPKRVESASIPIQDLERRSIGKKRTLSRTDKQLVVTVAIYVAGPIDYVVDEIAQHGAGKRIQHKEMPFLIATFVVRGRNDFRPTISSDIANWKRHRSVSRLLT
jgi:hypothetical protein